MIKITFFGTPNFSIPFLKSLLENENFHVQAIVTQEDKEIGRKKILTPPKIKQFCQNHESRIIVFQSPNTNKDQKLIETLKTFQSDFFIVVAFGQILSQQILDIPKYGCINVHASLLPKYRGASPIQQSLLNCDKKTGISIMEIVKKMDAGDIWQQKEIKITENDNLETLSEKLSSEGTKLLIETLPKIIEGKINKEAQNEAKATYCSKITKEDGQIDFQNDTSEKIINKIKAFTPWPSCYFFWKSKKIKLLEAYESPLQKNINKI